MTIPTNKISETILDFGEPLLSRFDETPPIAVMRSALAIVITVWNAHVMAMPVWGLAEHLERLIELLGNPSAPAELRASFDTLTRRRNERFRDDPRAVGEWAIEPAADGYRFRCDARLPHEGMIKG